MARLNCQCGAVYEIESLRSALPNTGKAICEFCKKEIDRWKNSAVYPGYKLMQRPDSDIH